MPTFDSVASEHRSFVSQLNQSPTTVAVIGGGFYGCVTAWKLANLGMFVTLFEQNSDLFRGTSGNYGIRIHAGPHYPRSKATRDSCRAVFRKFHDEFPSLVASDIISFYALGISDAEGKPARVSIDEFDSVCRESENCSKLDPKDWNVDNVQGLWKVYEPCIYQDRPRKLFSKLLKNHQNIKLVFNHHVNNLSQNGDQHISVDGKLFDWAVNCTYFTSFADQRVGGVNVIYQPCLTLTYEEVLSNPDTPHVMFTVMDGWFPCLMPMIPEEERPSHKKYMLYHAKYTILGSYTSFDECQAHVKSVSSEWVNKEPRPFMERHMEVFMPGFTKRFRYTGYLIDTATKLKRTQNSEDLLFGAKDVLYTNSLENYMKTFVPQMKSSTLLETSRMRLKVLPYLEIYRKS